MHRWIETHPDVNAQWHHLPLPIHEPAATREARWAECAGQVGGNAAFWAMIDWIYTHTRGNGQGLPAGIAIPGMSSALRACLANPRSLASITQQAHDAARDHIAATPTLRLIDHRSGRGITLPGAVSGDALLSAMDGLARPVSAAHPYANSDDKQADTRRASSSIPLMKRAKSARQEPS